MCKLVFEESSGSVCAGSKPQTDPEYSARGPSSLPILMIAWSMPRYRISRYLLSPTWPWTWSRVLAKSMGKVPETLKTNRFFYKTGSRRKKVSRTHRCVASAPASAPITHRILPSRKRARRRQKASSWRWTCPLLVVIRIGEKAALKPKIINVKSAAAAKFKSGRGAPALPFLPPCCRKPRPLKALLDSGVERPAHYLLPRNRSRTSKRATRPNFLG